MIDHIKQDHISRLVIRGYKSIVECDLKMTPLNVLIGANGAGKSNLISFFRLISRVLDQQLQATVGNLGGPDALLHFGRKKQNNSVLSYILATMAISLACSLHRTID